jgi:hypothetical protein
MAGGINGNQGAESMVSFLLSLLSILNSCAIIDRIQARTEPSSTSRLDPMDTDAADIHPSTEQTQALENPRGEPT